MDNPITKEMISNVLGSRQHMKFNPNCFLGYRKIVDSLEYSVYERPLKADKIVAAFNDTVVKKRDENTLIYLPNARIPQIKYIIKLRNNMFPGLYENSKIAQVLLLPYLRIIKKDIYIKDLRLCIFTNKGQIFHNKPARAVEIDGPSCSNDVIHFEESVVWIFLEESILQKVLIQMKANAIIRVCPWIVIHIHLWIIKTPIFGINMEMVGLASSKR